MADADEQALMESLLECTGWTNTPSKARLRRSRDLYNLIPEGGESRGEAAHFATCVQNAPVRERGGRGVSDIHEPRLRYLGPPPDGGRRRGG